MEVIRPILLPIQWFALNLADAGLEVDFGIVWSAQEAPAELMAELLAMAARLTSTFKTLIRTSLLTAKRRVVGTRRKSDFHALIWLAWTLCAI